MEIKPAFQPVLDAPSRRAFVLLLTREHQALLVRLNRAETELFRMCQDASGCDTVQCVDRQSPHCHCREMFNQKLAPTTTDGEAGE